MKISIDDQVAALRESVVAHQSYIRTVRRLVRDGERPEEILKDTEQRLPKMEAALKTLEWVQANREIIIEVYRKPT
jgi:outer membrane protein TolC